MKSTNDHCVYCSDRRITVSPEWRVYLRIKQGLHEAIVKHHPKMPAQMVEGLVEERLASIKIFEPSEPRIVECPWCHNEQGKQSDLFGLHSGIMV